MPKGVYPGSQDHLRRIASLGGRSVSPESIFRRAVKNKAHHLRKRIIKFEDSYIPEPNSGCWLWIDKIDKDGYGEMRSHRAHRFSFELYKGQIPEGLYILHKCNIPSCVNPDHLYPGTAKDNSRDLMLTGYRPTPPIATKESRAAGGRAVMSNPILQEKYIEGVKRGWVKRKEDPEYREKIRLQQLRAWETRRKNQNGK